MPGRFANLEFDDEKQREQQQPLRVEPRSFDASTYLCKASEEYRWGRFEPALRYFTRCLEENRGLVPAWVGQVQMLVQMGECHEARVWSDKALELFRNNGELLAAKSQACVRLGDRPAALASSDASLQAPGSSAWRWQARGEVLLAGRERHADHCFQKSLLEVGTDWFDRVVVARIYLHYNRATNALQHLSAAIELQPAHGYVWYERGNCERELGLISAAERSYRRCLELRGDYREAQEALRTLAHRSLFDRVRGLLRWR